MKPEKIIVGLGNPGVKYQGSRHNVGYMVLAELAKRFASGSPRRQFQADTFEVQIQGNNVLFLCPVTYMNLSGQAVLAALRFYKMEPEQLLIVCDDLDLPVSKMRMRISGGSGGQKGLQDTINRIGSNQFARLRIGIGRPPEHWDTADYVLSKFQKEENDLMKNTVARAADAVELWVTQGAGSVMNQYN